MVDYAGLTEEDISELCEELEGRLEAGVCDDSVCAGSLALVRALPLVMYTLELYRHRLKVCRANMKLFKKSFVRKTKG